MLAKIVQECDEEKEALEEKVKKNYFKWVRVPAEKGEDEAFLSDDEEAYLHPQPRARRRC